MMVHETRMSGCDNTRWALCGGSAAARNISSRFFPSRIIRVCVFFFVCFFADGPETGSSGRSGRGPGEGGHYGGDRDDRDRHGDGQGARRRSPGVTRVSSTMDLGKHHGGNDRLPPSPAAIDVDRVSWSRAHRCHVCRSVHRPARPWMPVTRTPVDSRGRPAGSSAEDADGGPRRFLTETSRTANDRWTAEVRRPRRARSKRSFRLPETADSDTRKPKKKHSSFRRVNRTFPVWDRIDDTTFYTYTPAVCATFSDTRRLLRAPDLFVSMRRLPSDITRRGYITNTYTKLSFVWTESWKILGDSKSI